LQNQLGVVNFGHLGDGNIHTTFLIDPRIPGGEPVAAAAAGRGGSRPRRMAPMS